MLMDASDVQKRGELSSVTYADASSGPDNEPIWTVECKSERYISFLLLKPSVIYFLVDGNVQGTGKGPTKADAKQAAAKEALNVS